MKIELMPMDQVIPYARNPRINAHAIEKVAASIKEFGFRQPIVTDKELVIVVGHVRFEAAKRLGLKKVPVHVATELTPEQIKAYRITDNRVGEESEWDKALLQLEITELDDASYDTDMLGFNAEELKEIQASLDGLDDGFRQTYWGGKVMTTCGVNELPEEIQIQAFRAVSDFDDFTEDNDPHGEHDFGRVEVSGHAFFWKIDYYDARMEYGSEDPANPDVTTRVLTIMLTQEY